MRTLFLLTMALLGTSAIAAPVPKELKKQQVSIVGVWKLESVMISGTAITVSADDTVWAIDENFTLIRSSGLKESAQNKTQLKFDTTTNELDWPVDGSVLLGRSEVSGDKLTISLGMKNLPRPAKLEPNAQNYVWILRRAEK